MSFEHLLKIYVDLLKRCTSYLDPTAAMHFSSNEAVTYLHRTCNLCSKVAKKVLQMMWGPLKDIRGIYRYLPQKMIGRYIQDGTTVL
jgi:hypothetical protein